MHKTYLVVLYAPNLQCKSKFMTDFKNLLHKGICRELGLRFHEIGNETQVFIFTISEVFLFIGYFGDIFSQYMLTMPSVAVPRVVFFYLKCCNHSIAVAMGFSESMGLLPDA